MIRMMNTRDEFLPKHGFPVYGAAATARVLAVWGFIGA